MSKTVFNLETKAWVEIHATLKKEWVELGSINVPCPESDEYDYEVVLIMNRKDGELVRVERQNHADVIIGDYDGSLKERMFENYKASW